MFLRVRRNVFTAAAPKWRNSYLLTLLYPEHLQASCLEPVIPAVVDRSRTRPNAGDPEVVAAKIINSARKR